MQDSVAQGFRLGCGEVAVEGEEAEPGEQVAGDGRGLTPGGVDLVVPGRQVAQAGGLGAADPVLDPSLGAVPGFEELGLAAGVLVAVTWSRLPSCCSNRDSCAPGCGFSRRIRIRMSGGHFANRSPSAELRSSPVSSATWASGPGVPSASRAGVHAGSGSFGSTSRIRSSKSSPTGKWIWQPRRALSLLM